MPAKAKGISVFACMSSKAGRKKNKRWRKMLEGQNNPAIAVLWGSFGGRKKQFKQLLDECAKSGKFYCEIHLINGASRRVPGGLHKGDFFPKDSVDQFNQRIIEMKPRLQKKIKKTIHEIQAITDSYLNGVFILSLGLEDNYTNTAAKALYNECQKHWKDEFCRNPVGNNPQKWKPPGAYFELHGFDANPAGHGPRTILNPDGQDVTFVPPYKDFPYTGGKAVGKPTFRKWLERGENAGSIIFFWCAKHQGLHVQNPGTTKNRRIRVDKSDVQTIRSEMW